jgi:hypothetical protein
MDSKLLIPACLLVILSILPSGSSIECHQCSSYKDVNCGDPFFFQDKPDQAKTSDYLKPCPADTDDKKYYCRKIFQNVRGDERVIRSCGWEKQEKECYSTVLEEYNTYVCQCGEDGCNSGTMFSVSSLAVFSTLLVAYMMQ